MAKPRPLGRVNQCICLSEPLEVSETNLFAPVTSTVKVVIFSGLLGGTPFSGCASESWTCAERMRKSFAGCRGKMGVFEYTVYNTMRLKGERMERNISRTILFWP